MQRCSEKAWRPHAQPLLTLTWNRLHAPRVSASVGAGDADSAASTYDAPNATPEHPPCTATTASSAPELGASGGDASAASIALDAPHPARPARHAASCQTRQATHTKSPLYSSCTQRPTAARPALGASGGDASAAQQ